MSTRIEQVRDALESAGIDVNETRPLPTGLGDQLRCAGGAVVVVYRTGKVVVQGKGADAVNGALKGLEGPAKAAAPAAPKPVRAAPDTSLPTAAAAAATVGTQGVYWNDLPWNGRDLPWDALA